MPLKDKEACKKYKAAWYQKNKERLLPKLKIRAKAWAKAHPEYKRAKEKRHYIKHKESMNKKYKIYWANYGRVRYYNLEPEDFNKMYLKQEGKCCICKKDIPLIGRETHIDHDHVTNKVRGLLCKNCNLGLGFFKDNISSILAAAEYLKEHS